MGFKNTSDRVESVHIFGENRSQIKLINRGRRRRQMKSFSPAGLDSIQERSFCKCCGKPERERKHYKYQ